MITSSININVNGNIQSFAIGTSQPALEAINHYKNYQSNNKYEELKNCFACFHFIVNKDPERKLNACIASAALASSVYKSSELNIYKRLFIATSVSSIIVNAGLCESLKKTKFIWDTLMIKNSQEMQKNEFNMQDAIEAGLAILEKK